MGIRNAAIIHEGGVSEAGVIPEYELLREVLATGLLDATGEGARGGESSPSALRRRQSKAISWVMSEEVYCSPERGISFTFICEILDIDTSVLRKAVQRVDDTSQPN